MERFNNFGSCNKCGQCNMTATNDVTLYKCDGKLFCDKCVIVQDKIK